MSGFFGGFLGWLFSLVLGLFLDKVIIQIDITIDSLKEALKDSEWREAALKAYEHASAKVYSEEEKIEIRKQYQDALAKYATYGNGVPVHKDSER